MIAYASATGTKTTIALLREHGWRVFVCATGHDKNSGLPYAIDNGAWHAYKNGKIWDQGKFEKLVESHGDGADFIVVPDVVGSGAKSYERSVQWLPRLAGVAPLYFAVQNEMSEEDLNEIADQIDGIFVGGTTNWKLDTMQYWGQVARHLGKKLHIGRVNTRRRIRQCHLNMADSFDGTSVSLYSKNIFHLHDELCQQTFHFLKWNQ